MNTTKDKGTRITVSDRQRTTIIAALDYYRDAIRAGLVPGQLVQQMWDAATCDRIAHRIRNTGERRQARRERQGEQGQFNATEFTMNELEEMNPFTGGKPQNEAATRP